MTTGQDVVVAARAMIGTPWRHQGRSAATGVDCIGLVVLVGVAAGLIPASADRTDYAREPDRRRLLEMLDAAAIRVLPVTARRPGDIVTCRDSATYPCHVGIFTGGGVIHASALHRQTIEESWTDDGPHSWTGKLIAVHRLPHLEG